MDKKKVILDVDTGSDDAVAIMTALLSPELEVLGICTVNGNRCIEMTTENTLRVVEYLGNDVPVFKGCHLPLVSSLTPGRRPHMPFTGQEDPEENVHSDYLDYLPAATIQPQRQNAVSWLVDTLMASDGDITLIPVGPLTNIAAAIRIQPEIVEKIKEIVIMGGAYEYGNITPAAEFNIWIDPEAAKIVLDCGAKITLVPLDATHRACISLGECDQLDAMNTRASKATSEFARYRIKGYRVFQPMEQDDWGPIHDALAVAAVIDPTVLKDVRQLYVDVDFSGGFADGMTICDVNTRDKKARKNCAVALNADREKFVSLVMRAMERSPK
ncbi:nucleoside hydrolase [Bittarella massiliensis (ex Durand et al. 2017)]|uniref:Nucleoside hydrolase n=1 Tax=Bittarella massiliensis (ex Durand et al. 2017) TaxID=1720313 RepID=A0AAW5KB76_9FIRM|nr:nucleoside hydrolase [Bittarella massiliensis (ex Durand et al. 2017)]MCQ4949245.1 nucleoside hydrolase [Bittarella massiliensis (ex Durand et al. 2017)]